MLEPVTRLRRHQLRLVFWYFIVFLSVFQPLSREKRGKRLVTSQPFFFIAFWRRPTVTSLYNVKILVFRIRLNEYGHDLSFVDVVEDHLGEIRPAVFLSE